MDEELQPKVRRHLQAISGDLKNSVPLRQLAAEWIAIDLAASRRFLHHKVNRTPMQMTDEEFFQLALAHEALEDCVEEFINGRVTEPALIERLRESAALYRRHCGV